MSSIKAEFQAADAENKPMQREQVIAAVEEWISKLSDIPLFNSSPITGKKKRKKRTAGKGLFL